MADFVRVPETDWQDILDATREKTGGTEKMVSSEVASAIAGIQVGVGSGGIGAVKFIDVDITVDASTTTAVTYTVDGLEMVSSAENPTKWTAFPADDVYMVFIKPKNLTGTESDATNIYNTTLCTLGGSNNETRVASTGTSYGSSNGVTNQSYGIYAPKLTCTEVVDGKPMGTLTVTVRHHSASGYNVIAGTYNVQIYYLTDFDWGHIR